MSQLGCMKGFTTETVCRLLRSSSPSSRTACAFHGGAKCMSISAPTNAPSQFGMGIRMRLNDESPESPLHGSAVCAVLVTYHPDSELPARLSRMAPQVGALVIVDNGSAETELRMLRELAADPRIHLILNFENLGVARALNLGVQRAASL